MKRCVTITCNLNLATGKANLNEIVYQIKEMRDTLMLKMLEQILFITLPKNWTG